MGRSTALDAGSSAKRTFMPLRKSTALLWTWPLGPITRRRPGCKAITLPAITSSDLPRLTDSICPADSSSGLLSAGAAAVAGAAKTMRRPCTAVPSGPATATALASDAANSSSAVVAH